MDLPPWLQHGCRVEIVRFHLDSTNPDCRHTTWFEPAKVVEVIAQTGKVHVLKHGQRKPCLVAATQLRPLAPDDKENLRGGCAVDALVDGAWHTGVLASPTGDNCSSSLTVLSADSMEFRLVLHTSIRRSYIFKPSCQPCWVLKQDMDPDLKAVSLLQHVAGNTMGCGYKGVVELVAEGCSSWTANIKVNGLPQPQQPVGSSSLQAVAAWMHDEGLRMLFELKGVRCRNDLLNLDADMLETVLTRLGLSHDELPRPLLNQETLEAVRCYNQAQQLLQQAAGGGCADSRPSKRQCLQSSEPEASSGKSSSAVMNPADSQPPSTSSGGHPALLVDQQQQQQHSPHSTSVALGEHAQLQKSSVSDDRSHQAHSEPAAAAGAICSADDTPSTSNPPSSQANARSAPSPPLQQTPGLTMLTAGAMVEFLCSGGEGDHTSSSSRFLLLEAQVGSGGAAEVWRVREVLSRPAGQQPEVSTCNKPAPIPTLAPVVAADGAPAAAVETFPANPAPASGPVPGSAPAEHAAPAATGGASSSAQPVGRSLASAASTAHQGYQLSDTPLALKASLKFVKSPYVGKMDQVEYVQGQLDWTNTEYSVMSKAAQQQSQHIVRVHCKGAVICADSEVLYCMLMEYAAVGSLASQLQEWRGGLMKPKGFSADDTWDIVGQVAMGLAELHQLDAFHRDLKPANVIGFSSSSSSSSSDSRGQGGGASSSSPAAPAVRWKLGDFGAAKKVSNMLDYGTTQIGTLYYRPPEVLMNLSQTCHVDIYLLGLLYLEVRFGSIPFLYRWAAQVPEQQIKLTMSLELQKPECIYNQGMPSGFDGFSPPLADDEKKFLRFCLQPTPTQRPPVKTLLQWFPKLRGKQAAV